MSFRTFSTSGIGCKIRFSVHSPSHPDLLGDLRIPAILDYQEHPKTRHKHTKHMIPKHCLAAFPPQSAYPVLYGQRPTTTEAKPSDWKKRGSEYSNTPPNPSSFSQTAHRDTYVHTFMHEYTLWQFPSTQASLTIRADNLSIKIFFHSLAVLHLWEADRSVGECDTHCWARGSWWSFYKHPLEKEKKKLIQ